MMPFYNCTTHMCDSNRKRQRTSSTQRASILGLLVYLQIRTIHSFTDIPYHKHSHSIFDNTLQQSILHSTKTKKPEIPNEIQSDDIIKNYDIVSKDKANGYKIGSNGHEIPNNGYTIPPNITKNKLSLWSKKYKATNQKLWSRRHAKSVDEGIRREQTTNLLNSVIKGSFLKHDDATDDTLRKNKRKRRYGARTIAALIVALAEEAQGLQVEINARDDTPLWHKYIDTVRINFSRLGFKPLQLSGLDQALHTIHEELPPSTEENFITTVTHPPKQRFPFNILKKNTTITADEIFTHIDKDNSGELDEEELASALYLAMDPELAVAELTNTTNSTSNRNISKEVLKTLAAQLVRLYDLKDSKGIDRSEYQSMVEDMAALRRAQREKAKIIDKEEKTNFGLMRRLVVMLFGKSLLNPPDTEEETELEEKDTIVDITNKPILAGEGSITLTNLQLDLRRLVFGAVPWIKRITPGGPLILQPFTMTATGSFTRDDLLNSDLLNTGLRLLVAQALRRRVRSVRDLFDGAVFYGRTWNLASDHAPTVEVPILTNIEFDKQDRVIISGRAQVRASPDAPFIENAFKLRTRIGTGLEGRVIRLTNPELALVLECPESWERGIVGACRNLKLPIPTRPNPIYTYIPLVSPLKVNRDRDGYYLGEDNCIQSIDIKDGALRFELSAVLRPGRFLGNHYIAFTVPQRTFIVTLDRLKEGIRVARRNKLKRKKEKLEQAAAENSDDENDYRFKSLEDEIEQVANTPKNKDGFISRFVQGYMLHAMTEESKEDEQYSRFASAISEWFGGQHEEEDE